MVDDDSPGKELFQSVGECLSEWTGVETALSALFVALHGKGVNDWGDPLRASFEAVLSFETRVAMIAAAANSNTKMRDYRPHYSSLKNKLSRCYKRRHEVAHYSLVSRTSGRTMITTHTLKPFFTWADFLRSTGRDELNVKVIDERTATFIALADRVWGHVRYILHVTGQQLADDVQPDDLILLLQTPADQNPKASERPPQSSEG